MSHRKPRRSYGEGSIFKATANGKTYHVARISTIEHGRRRYRTKWCKDETEARKALKKLKAQVAQGKRVFGERTTLRSWLTTWHQERIPNVAPQTTMDYARNLAIITKRLGPVILADFSPDDAISLYHRLRKDGRSTATLRRVHLILHKAFADAVRRRMIDYNPLDSVDTPRHTPREVEPYTLDEIRTLLAAATGDALEPLWILALFSQAREGELFALRWRDVDLRAGAITVARALQDVSHSKRRIASPKTATSRRRIEIPAIAVASLSKALERARESPQHRETDLVFSDRLGGPLRRQNVLRRHLYPLLDKAELRRIHFHALRHSGATLLAEHIPLVALKERLGHASISTTANVYVHRSPSLQRLAAARLDELFPANEYIDGVEAKKSQNRKKKKSLTA